MEIIVSLVEDRGIDSHYFMCQNDSACMLRFCMNFTLCAKDRHSVFCCTTSCVGKSMKQQTRTTMPQHNRRNLNLERQRLSTIDETSTSNDNTSPKRRCTRLCSVFFNHLPISF